MPSSTLWGVIIALLFVIFAIHFGIRWSLFKLQRRHREIAAALLFGICMVALILLPARNPARRRTDQITLLVALAVATFVGAVVSLRRSRTVRMFAEWAITHGFTVTSKSRSKAQETLPESLLRLPLLRTGQEPETRYVLKRNDPIHDLQTMIFGFVTSRIAFSPWAPGPRDRPLVMTVFAFRRQKLHLPAFELRIAKIADQGQDDNLGSTRVELFGKPRFGERYALHAQQTAELERVFSDEVVNALERERGWCLEGLGEWCIAYRYHQAKTFWTFRPSGFEDCTNTGQLSARHKTADNLFRLMTARPDARNAGAV
jgi:hypothetical protein